MERERENGLSKGSYDVLREVLGVALGFPKGFPGEPSVGHVPRAT